MSPIHQQMHIYNEVHVLIITFPPTCVGACCTIFRENIFVYIFLRCVTPVVLVQ